MTSFTLPVAVGNIHYSNDLQNGNPYWSYGLTWSVAGHSCHVVHFLFILLLVNKKKIKT